MRRYGEWAGNPKGNPEDTARCIESVPDSGGWIPHQCSRKRGHGPNGEWCKQHGKREEKRREWAARVGL